MLTMMTGAAGMIGFGFLASWIFGREYVERTFKDLLAVPVSRYSIITAKFLVLGTWCILLAVLFLLLGFLAGMVVGLAGWSGQTIEQGIITYALTSSLTLLLVTVVAFFASLGRGYLPPLAFMILTLLLANVITLLGYGPYFPWAIPILASGAGGKDAAQVETASYIILFLTSIAGLAGTFAWWRFADQA
jgi:ABC-2 type transport system permease protein